MGGGEGEGGRGRGHAMTRAEIGKSMEAVRATAHEAHRRRIVVTPPRADGSKRPVGKWRALRESPPTDELVEAWWGPNSGVGFLTGSVSGGLELFEFDDPATYDRFVAAAAEVGLTDLVARIDSGYHETTPGAGHHWLYFCEEVRGNTKLAERPGGPDARGRPTRDVLIETRGEGGFVVAAPSFGSIHPSGKPYILISGGVGSIAEITAAERDALWALARSFDEMPPEPARDAAARPPGDGAAAPRPHGPGGGAGGPANGGDLRPGDDFNARATWTEILEPHGWRPAFSRGGTTYWTRPGKDPSAGHSATTGHGGGDCLWVFSSSTEFEPEKSYTKFGAWVRLNHGGDFEAGARALGAAGYGSRPAAGANGANVGNGHHATAAGAGGPTIPPARPPIDPAAVRAAAEAILATGRIEALYLAQEFHTDLARLEVENPAQAEAIKAMVRRLEGYREGGFKNVMTAHRQALRQPGAAPAAGLDADDGHPEFTDRGNAVRLVERHGARIRYCKPYGEWLIYDGRRWALDSLLAIEAMAQQVPGIVLSEIPPGPSPDAAEPFRKWAILSQSKERTMALIHLARSMVAVAPTDLDRNPWLLNVRNGTIDLAAETGREFRPHAAGDLVTKLAPVEYDPAAACPTWDRFILEIMGDDDDLADYLQRALGYAITGVVREHAFFFLYGTGRNGKTTALKTLFTILGDYANEIDSDLLISQNNAQHPTGLTELEGRRLVMADEADDGRRLAEAQVKKLTGGNPIQARRMHQDFYTFLPSHHLFFAANHKPEIRGTDPGIWRRVKLIPFTVSFDADMPGGRLPDLDLEAKLLAEAPGILNWLVAGCRKWRARGLAEPPRIKEVVSDYRSEMDTLGWFLGDATAADPARRELLSTLYGKYVEWCRTNNSNPLSIRKFSAQLGDRGFLTEKSNSKVFKRGLRLKTIHEILVSREDEEGYEGDGPAY